MVGPSHSSATDSQHEPINCSIESIKAHGNGRVWLEALHTCEYNEVRGVETLLSICLCRSHRATPPARPTCRRSSTGADLDSRTPAIIVLPVSCPVVPLGPSHWRVGRWQHGRWHKSRHHLRARRVVVQHATPARRENLCTCHGPRLAVVCTCFGLAVPGLACPGLTCRCLQPNKGPPDAKRIAQNK
jgi:hypothetical protein